MPVNLIVPLIRFEISGSARLRKPPGTDLSMLGMMEIEKDLRKIAVSYVMEHQDTGNTLIQEDVDQVSGDSS